MPMRLDPPPGWPEPPRGWRPPPGWEPPAQWPDPPPGWRLWVADERAGWARAHPVLAGAAAVVVGVLLLAALDLLPGRLDDPPPPPSVAAGRAGAAARVSASPPVDAGPGSERTDEPRSGMEESSYGGAQRAGSAGLVEAPVRGRAFGDGEHRVGQVVLPGTYRSGPAPFCYWARLGAFGDGPGTVLARGSAGDEIVTVREDDVGFVTQGCGSWRPVDDLVPAEPLRSFADGTYRVGVDVAPGAYRVADGTDADPAACLWSRLNDFEHDAGSNHANGNTVDALVLAPDDVGFSTRGCGTWVPAD